MAKDHELYLTFLNANSEEQKHDIDPYYFDFTNSFKIIKLDNESRYKQFIDANFAAIQFVRNFPGRTIKNMKINLENNKVIVYTTYLDSLKYGWYGVSILYSHTSFLPLKNERKMADNIYNSFCNYFESTEKVKTEAEELLRKKDLSDIKRVAGIKKEARIAVNDLKKNLKEYLSKTFEENINTQDDDSIELCKSFNCLNQSYSLEEIITPTSSSMTKWDFFIINNSGIPITGIMRYSHGGFFKLDMNRLVNIPGYSEQTLSDFNIHNSSSLSACNNACSVLGPELGLGKSSLKHITTDLGRGKGYGFTFIEELNQEGDIFLLVMDVKNKISINSPYVDKLFGNERKTLVSIKKEIEDKKLRFGTFGEQLDGKELETVYKLFKSVISKNAII